MANSTRWSRTILAVAGTWNLLAPVARAQVHVDAPANVPSGSPGPWCQGLQQNETTNTGGPSATSPSSGRLNRSGAPERPGGLATSNLLYIHYGQ